MLAPNENIGLIFEQIFAVQTQQPTDFKYPINIFYYFSMGLGKTIYHHDSNSWISMASTTTNQWFYCQNRLSKQGVL